MKKTFFVRAFFVTFMVTLFVLSGISSVSARATDNASEGRQITGTIVTLDRDASAYSSASEDSEVLHEFKAGEPIFVSGQEGAFTSIYYGGYIMYIKTEAITQEAIEASEEAAKELEEAVQEEAESRSERDQAYLESLIRQEEQKKNALIWKIIIGVLVVAIIAVSVVIGISNSKKANK